MKRSNTYKITELKSYTEFMCENLFPSPDGPKDLNDCLRLIQKIKLELDDLVRLLELEKENEELRQVDSELLEAKRTLSLIQANMREYYN